VTHSILRRIASCRADRLHHLFGGLRSRFASRLVAVCSIVAVILASTVSPVLAHANLERSLPAANAVLVDQPRLLQLWFSEEPEFRLTALRLLDARGREVALLPARPVPGEARSIQSTVPEVPPGTYLVTWRTTSAIDGHTTAGSFPFTFGLGQAPTVISLGASADESFAPSPANVLARAASFSGALALTGASLAWPLVLWPAFGRPNRRGGGRRTRVPEDSEAPIASAWRIARNSALVAVVAGTLLAILAQAADVAAVSLFGAFGAPVARILGSTRVGVLLAVRLALAVGLAVWLVVGWQPDLTPPTERGWWRFGVSIGLCFALLATFALGAHAAAAPSLTALAIVVDWIHLVAASVWTGGLLILALVLVALSRGQQTGQISRARFRALAGVLVGRFSVVAAAVLVLILTGLVQSAINVGSPAALVGTPYGRALIVKLTAVLLMALLGLFHWRWFGPRWRSGEAPVQTGVGVMLERLAARFPATVFVEAALAVVVIAGTAYMTASQPARDAAIQQRSVTAAGRADDLTLAIRVAPGEAGLNRVDLDVGGPIGAIEKVVLRLRHDDMEMGEQEIELRPVESGGRQFRIEGGHFSMIGRWQVEPLVRRSGLADARVVLPLTIDEPLSVRNENAPPPFELTGRMVLALEASIFGAILALGAARVRTSRRRVGNGVLGGGLAIAIVGVALFGVAVRDELSSTARVRAPITVDREALVRGALLYQQNCLTCHGFGGRGDGPLARTLASRPADLRLHVMEHAEGQLWRWISDGVPGTAMPAFRGQIDDDDRWRLVAFIKGFSETGPAPAQTVVATLRPPREASPVSTAVPLAP
jgi:copper transport protein